MTPVASRLAALEAVARRAASGSYAPYSRFPVGAAVLAEDGVIYPGCNIENASFGLSCCAERVAVFSAVAAGNRRLLAVAVYTPTPQPTAPCGACRQILAEFGAGAHLVCCCAGEGRLETEIDALLPEPFGPASLDGEGGA